MPWAEEERPYRPQKAGPRRESDFRGTIPEATACVPGQRPGLPQPSPRGWVAINPCHHLAPQRGAI